MFILEALEHYAKTDHIALRYHDEQVSFAALNRMADAFAAYLRCTLPDDCRPVMIYGHKQSFIPACMFGALKAGLDADIVVLTGSPLELGSAVTAVFVGGEKVV